MSLPATEVTEAFVRLGSIPATSWASEAVEVGIAGKSESRKASYGEKLSANSIGGRLDLIYTGESRRQLCNVYLSAQGPFLRQKKQQLSSAQERFGGKG
jgi:hypothetical protein